MLTAEQMGPWVQKFVDFATMSLVPMMILAFIFAIVVRFLIYNTVKRNEWFAKEFEKRVNSFMEGMEKPERISFYVTLKRLLEKTFYECFVTRSIMKRRKPDAVMSFNDRIFLIQQGSAWLIKDLLKKVKFLKMNDHQPNLLQISKTTFQKNPCFNNLFGLIPVGGLNDILNLLPGILIVSGIFGTFLGIMSALPELREMDLKNAELTKEVMNQFLSSVSFAMSSSLLGIGLSVTLSFLNTILSPEKLFVRVVDRFESSLNTIWHLSDSNDLPLSIKEFDEHKDPMEALAEAAVDEELSSKKGSKVTRSTETNLKDVS